MFQLGALLYHQYKWIDPSISSYFLHHRNMIVLSQESYHPPKLEWLQIYRGAEEVPLSMMIIISQLIISHRMILKMTIVGEEEYFFSEYLESCSE